MELRTIYSNLTDRFKGFFGPNIVIHQQEQNGVTVRTPRMLDKELEHVAIERIRHTLSDWANAVNEAEDPDFPLYDGILDIYHNIELDEHVVGLIDTIFNRVSQTPFQITNQAGEVDEDKTKLFEKSWFYDFMNYYLEGDYWPFSLIQFDAIKDGIFTGCTSVDRYHIRPEKNGVSVHRGIQEPDFYYDKAPLDKWTMFVKSRRHLGRYNAIAKRFMLKRDVNQFWAVYNELFTTPYFTVNTDLNNKNHRSDLLAALKGRKHSGFIFVGAEDEINAISNSGQGWASYDKFEDKQNNGMSKAFLGGTMVMDDGSSRSQSEVHERQLELFINAKRIMLEFAINEELIPKASYLGANLTAEDRFKFTVEDNLSLKDWADIINILATHYDIDLSEITDKFGLTLSEKQKEQLTTGEDVAKAIKNLYNITE